MGLTKVQYDSIKEWGINWLAKNKYDLEKIPLQERPEAFEQAYLQAQHDLYVEGLRVVLSDEAKKTLVERCKDLDSEAVIFKRDVLAGLIKGVYREEKLDRITIGSTGLSRATLKQKYGDIELETERRTYWVEIKERSGFLKQTHLATVYYHETNEHSGDIKIKEQRESYAIDKIKKRLGINLQEPLLPSSQKAVQSQPPQTPLEKKKPWWKLW